MPSLSREQVPNIRVTPQPGIDVPTHRFEPVHAEPQSAVYWRVTVLLQLKSKPPLALGVVKYASWPGYARASPSSQSIDAVPLASPGSLQSGSVEITVLEVRAPSPS